MADTPQHEQGKIESKNDLSSVLPAVESPSISPASEQPPASTVATALPAPEVAPPPEALPLLRFRLNARHKRYGLLAASVALAAALGAVVGALASGGLAAPKQTAVARVEDNKAVQQTITRLSKELATLKANVEAANKSAHAQIAKISDRLGERLSRESAEITGSISASQTVAPVPLPKPAQRVAAAEAQVPARPPVVAGWSIRDVRDGYVYVQGHGDIYEVSIGAPLPGLGRVEQVKRRDGRWVVVTPKGLIVSQRDRHYFD